MELQMEDRKKKLYKHCIAVLREPVKSKKPISKENLQEIRISLSLDYLNESEIIMIEKELESVILDRISYFTRGNRGFKVSEYEEIQKKSQQLFGYYMKNRENYSHIS